MPDKINWYPGHMAKSRRLLSDQLKLVDAVIELCDARAPMATRNSDLVKLTENKVKFVILNKADLADDAETAKWLKVFRDMGYAAIRFNSNGARVNEVLKLIEEATKPVIDRYLARGIKRTARLMVTGIPNVGKSTFINRIHGSPIAKSADKPGVTRSNQWVKISQYLELLDTPGLLPPKIENQDYAKLLSYLGSVRDDILNTEELAGELLSLLYRIAPDKTAARFKLKGDMFDAPEMIMEAACKGRGWLLSGGRYDFDRASALILDEFRAGKVGRITLQSAEDNHARN